MLVIHPVTKKERNIKDLKVVTHTLSRNGVDEDVKCVEFTVVGNNSEWTDWALYKDFEKANPSIKIK